MTTEHHATPEQWAIVASRAASANGSRYIVDAENAAPLSCLLELRSRIEALEATQHEYKAEAQPADDVQPLALVERVAAVVGKDVHYARRAIRVVAEWVRENPGPNSAWPAVARDLMDEANR